MASPKQTALSTATFLKGDVLTVLKKLTDRKCDLIVTSPPYNIGKIRPAFDVVPQLQANFAFTKAYVAESSGSASGLSGAKFFVDLSLFKSRHPGWLQTAGIIDWRHERLGLTAEFAEVSGINRKGHIEGGPLEIRDGLQVAENLTGDKRVLDALRQQLLNSQTRRRNKYA